MPKFQVIRSCAHDTQWLFALDAAVRTLDCYSSECRNRIEAISEAEAFDRARADLRRITENVTYTFPQEKWGAIERQLGNLFYRIDTGKPLNPRTNTLVDVDELDTLIRYAHDFNCKTCSHPSYCGSRCELGKVLDHMLPQQRNKKESWADIDVTRED